MTDIVRQWYEDKKNIDEMVNWQKGKLKKWEQEVAEVFPKEAKILDVGCGMGREAYVLTDMGFSVTGIDISKEVISQVTQLSKQNGYNIPFLIYDGHILPFDDNSFDVVVIWAQTFGIMYGDAYKASFLNECRRVLKKNGLLSFSGHDYRYEIEHYKQYTEGRKFYPYANSEIYWKHFYLRNLQVMQETQVFPLYSVKTGKYINLKTGRYCIACAGNSDPFIDNITDKKI
jgi:ubiquinone/menaquinone biosynthesis C-methylase UbiE